MRALWVAALVGAASILASGCKSNKPEPIPGPKVGTALGQVRSSGIAWFQGSVEEAFSRTRARRPAGQNPGTSHQWASCPPTAPADPVSRTSLKPNRVQQRIPAA